MRLLEKFREEEVRAQLDVSRRGQSQRHLGGGCARARWCSGSQSDELGKHRDWAQVRFLKGKGTRSRHWFEEEMVGFVEWRPMGHYPGGPQAGTRSTFQESLACGDGLGERG